MLVQDKLKKLTSLFKEQGFDHPLVQAENFLCDLLTCERADLYSFPCRLLSSEQLLLAEEWIKRRLLDEPLPYISGSLSFYGCSLFVSPSVLIPRQETEILVDKIVEELRKDCLKGKIFLDLCCGSGCIGIAIKKQFPALEVYLSDISPESLRVAERNAKENGVDVLFLEGDLFSPFLGKKADFIACNPPYISSFDYLHLEPSVKNYEPRLALEAGKSGLEFYQRLEKELSFYLKAKGKVWLEIGTGQGKDLEEMFSASSWSKIRVEKDWAGHDRFFFLENE